MSETSAPKPKKLLDLLRDAIRLKHYTPSTEKTYIQWAKRYILFHHKRHPTEMGVPEIDAFLTHLAQAANVSASTQNQAFNALVFLYRNVLHMELDAPFHALRAKRTQHLPTVLSREEVARVLQNMQGLHQLMAKLLYGSGLRLMECLHERDLANGYGSVELPYALARKYPNADKELPWQYVFPSDRLSTDPRSGSARRHRLDPSGLQRAVKTAASQLASSFP